MSLLYVCHRARVLQGRDEDKYRKWSECLFNILHGDITTGSRIPLRDTPVFLTPEVLPGGFASGRLCAGGDLTSFEQELYNECIFNTSVSDNYELSLQRRRESLNHYFLTSNGLARLRDMLHSGLYYCKFPEEGALLAVVWMLERDDIKDALDLVNKIAPFFGQVRFYPQPSPTPVCLDLRCSLLTVQAFKRGVSDIQISKGSLSYAVNKLIVDKLAPNYDRLVSLVLATCGRAGDDLLPFAANPSIQMTAAFQSLFRSFDSIQRTYDAFRYLAQRSQEQLKQLGRSRYCGIMLTYAKVFVDTESRITDQCERKAVQNILFQIRDRSRRGLPHAWAPGETSDSYETDIGSLPQKLRDFRLRQRQTTVAEHQLVTRDWKDLTIVRTSNMNADEHDGVEDVQAVIKPVTGREAAIYGLKHGATVPRSIYRMATRLQRRTLEELVEGNLVPSMEVMATLVDQILGAAQARWQGSTEVRRLYTSIVRAFRLRRSLLLLNYEHQVKLKELPWMNRLEEVRREECAGEYRENNELFCDLVRTCMSRWPNVPIPNKLISALNHMAQDFAVRTEGGTWVGLTPELAADIFMGGFTLKWNRHACIARDMLSSSLYGYYYGDAQGKTVWDELECVDTTEIEFKPDASQFAKICKEHARSRRLVGYVARNGATIEQSMVLTGHNYPYLVQVLRHYGKAFESDELLEICIKCFNKLKRRLRIVLHTKTPWRTRLRITKNVVYGWRQLLILVSCMNNEDIAQFFSRVCSRAEAASGCTLQRAAMDAKAIWIWMRTGEAPEHPHKALYGWQGGQHVLWEVSWCEKMRGTLDCYDPGTSCTHAG